FVSLHYSSDTAPNAIYTLSLHDALPISLEHEADVSGAKRSPPSRGKTVDIGAVDAHAAGIRVQQPAGAEEQRRFAAAARPAEGEDRKSTRLNSSHLVISYAVFCLKKKTT